MKIGVLALQGAVAEHIRMINSLGGEAVAIKKVEQLSDIDGLILPGGESTTMGKLMRQYGFIEELKGFVKKGKPVFGTCAGLILLADKINGNDENHIGGLNVLVERNAFGRQRDSFEADLPINDVADDFKAVFIRAPYIMEIGNNVEVLSVYKDRIVGVKQGNILGTAFHPELTDDLRMHKYFVDMVKENNKQIIKNG